MNVMKVAHNQAKLIRVGTDMSYREALRIALRQAHKAYKAMKNAEKQMAIAHFEDVISRTLVQFEKLGVNDYYVAVENNAKLNDYTLLTHKVEGDTSSALGWASYSTAIVTSAKQADMYVNAYPGVVKLHAQTYLSKVLDNFRDGLEAARK